MTDGVHARPPASGAHRSLLDVLLDPWVLLAPLRDDSGRVRDFEYADANDAACRDAGRPREALVGTRWRDPLPGHRPAHLVDACARVLETGEPLVLDGLRDDDAGRCYDVRAVALDGLLSYTWRDVTATQAARERLAADEEHYRLVAEHTTDVVYTLDAEGVVTWVSPSVVDALGFTADDLVGRRVRTLFHPDDLSREGARRDAIRRAGGTGGRAELRVATAAGGWRWMSLAGTAVLDDGGAVVGGLESLRDVDAEVSARERLAASERQYRLVTENVSDVVLLTGADRRIRWVAPSVTRALGWRPEELLGGDVARLLEPHGLDGNRWLAGLIDGTLPRSDFTTAVHIRGGGSRWFTGRATAVRDERTGDLVGFVVGMRDVTTERQSAAEAQRARHAEELARFSLDAAAIGMAIVTFDGVVRRANLAFADMMGRAQHEVVGLTVADLTHPDEVADSREGVRAVVAGECPVFRQRKRYLRPDGDVVWGDVAVTPVYDADGALSHLVAQIVDVTAEVAALERWRTESERFRLLAETASDVVYRTGADGLIEWISPSVRTILGWDPALLVGTPALGLIDPEDAPRAAAERSAMYQQGRTVRTAVRFRTAAGGARLMAVTARAATDDDGRVTGGVVGLRDVTEAVEARRALARSERHFRLAMATAPEGMAISDLDGSFRQVNPALARLLRRPPDDLIGRSLEDFAAPDAAAGTTAAREALLAGDADTAQRLVRLDVDGDELWVEHAVSLMDGQEGEPFLVEQFSDRTAATRLQQELEFQARHDQLTGVSNRADLLTRLRARFDVPDTGPRPAVGVLYVDVDGFKEINDRYGHAAGDAVLAAVAARIRACLRLGDVVGRVGGDEFVVVLGGLDDHVELRRIAAKVQRAASRPTDAAGVSVPVTISVGATLAAPDADPDQALAAADRALYRAKSAGRDRVVVDAADPH